MRFLTFLLFLFGASLHGQERKLLTKEELPELIKQLQAEPSDDRMKALMNLILLGEDALSAQSQVERVLDKDPFPPNRGFAARILLKLDSKHPKAEKYLRDSIVTKDRQEMSLQIMMGVPEVAIRVLVDIPEKTTLPELLGLVLQKFANQDVEVILPLLKAKNPQVRDASLIAIRQTKLNYPFLVRHLIEAAAIDRDFGETISKALNAMGEVAFEPLRKAMTHENANIRFMATLALNELRMVTTSKQSQQLAKDFTERLKDSDEEIRQYAARGIGYHAAFAKEAIPSLIRLLEDKNLDVKRATIVALGKIGPEAILAKEGLLRIAGLDRKFRVLAIEALSQIQPTCKELIPHAVGALSDSGSHRQMVLRSLARMGETALQAVEAIESILDSEDPEDRCYAAYALIAIGSNKKKAIEVLRTYLLQGEENYQRLALELCRQAGSKAKDFVPDLIQLSSNLNNESPIPFLATKVLRIIDPEAAKKLGMGEEPRTKK